MPDAAPLSVPSELEGRAPIGPAAAFCALFALVGALLVSDARSYGWDESMHAALPAARMALALRAGEPMEAIDVALGCQQYPFVYPALLAGVELVFGVSEGVARALGRVIWGVGLFGLFLAAREAVRRAGWSPDPKGAARARLAPYVALFLGALSPLAMLYSGTLFQEIPFAALAAWAVWAWLRRDGGARRELVAGALVTLAFFTRFNTGLLLGFALFVDLLVDGALAARAGELRAFARRTAWLAAIPALAFAWWFGLPLPRGTSLGAEHRHALFAFLQGNRGDAFRIPWTYRAVDWGIAFAASPRALLLILIGVAASAGALLRPGVRTLWILLFAAGVPVWIHEFHLDRFLLHQGVAIWSLAGVGIARLAPGRRPALVAAAALALCVVFPSLDARPYGRALIRPDAAKVDYVHAAIDAKGALAPWRELATNGLARDESAAILDLVAGAAGTGDRVAWLGINSELSPAAIHLGLLDRGGSKERFRRDAGRARADGQPAMCVSFEGLDPGWDAERVRAWAGGFDVVITTRPVDLRGRAARDWVRRYQEMLLVAGGWGIEKLGTVDVARPNHEPTTVEVFACRKT